MNIKTLLLTASTTALLLAACTTKKENTLIQQVSENEGVAQGKLLIEKSDCMSCHAVDVKKIGPSFQDIAKKYPANDQNVSQLSQKIIKGGSGAWGPIAMSPHADISEEKAKEMINYILSL
ncbi:c-type cytochrome [Fulvivirga ligni]|uniref:c-type cytochrome n=1 Tax=Fulvivirga ligni TaxID=2904246 RepID=UPI001F3E9A4C|nr:c-type cytochrome [Fulvivirga ligni]UII18962.1 c-type cytochrome [Fulvivirga ligni]